MQWNDPAAKDFWKQYRRDLHTMPRAWAGKGENLIHAFEAVANASQPGSMNLDLHDQALMLAGMSVEVQLKAILIKMPDVVAVVAKPRKENDSVKKKLWDVFYSHQLDALAFEAKIALTIEQMRTAASLSQYIFWRGRYVVPMESGIDDLMPKMQPSGMVGMTQDASFDTARDLIARVVSEVKARLY